MSALPTPWFTAQAAHQTVEVIGWPEARIQLPKRDLYQRRAQE